MNTAKILFVLGSFLLVAVRGQAASAEDQLEALKAKFPEARTSDMKVTMGKKKNETFEVKMPPADVWAKYHGMVAAATLPTLASVISRLEYAKRSDNIVLQNQQKTLVGTGAKEQARATAGWLNGQLAGYVAKLKALVPGPATN